RSGRSVRPDHDERTAAGGGGPVRSWQGPTPPMRPVEIIAILVALAQLIATVVGPIHVAPAVRLALGGLSVGIATRYLLSMRPLRQAADRLALGLVGLPVPSLVSAILVTCGSLYLA